MQSVEKQEEASTEENVADDEVVDLLSEAMEARANFKEQQDLIDTEVGI